MGVIDFGWDADERGEGDDEFDPDVEDVDEAAWITAQDFFVPFLATTSTHVSPNLVLLFTIPQRIPALRWMAGQLDLPVRKSRREPGVRVDGVALRAVDPDAAAQTLLARGVIRISDDDEFILAHRETVHDPEVVRRTVTYQERAQGWSLGLGLATLAFAFGAEVFDDHRWAIPAGLALVSSFLVP